MDKITVEYRVELKGERVNSGDDFYQFVKELAGFATVGTSEAEKLIDISDESRKRIAACRGAAKVKDYQEKDSQGKVKVGSFTLELPVENFDNTRLEVNLLLGVIAGDVLGNPEIKDVKILSIEVPPSVKKRLKGPKMGLEGVKGLFNLGKRPLLAFTAKPRLGLTPEDHAKICYLALRGGADLAEDDERLVNPSYCPYSERVEKCVKAAERASEETGEKKVYSVNLTGREDEIIQRFEYLDKIARAKSGGGLECVKIDVPPVGFGGLQAFSEYLHETGKNVLVTVYPELYWFYRRLFPAGFFVGLLRWCGADVLYAGTPVILDHFGEKGKTPSIITPRLAEVKHDIYEGALWKKESGAEIKRAMPTVTGSVYPITMDLLYTFLGGNIGFFIGDGMLKHPGGVEEGARACRRALDAAVARKKYTEVFTQKEREEDEERFRSNYVDPRVMIKKNPNLKEFVEVPL